MVISKGPLRYSTRPPLPQHAARQDNAVTSPVVPTAARLKDKAANQGRPLRGAERGIAIERDRPVTRPRSRKIVSPAGWRPRRFQYGLRNIRPYGLATFVPAEKQCRMSERDVKTKQDESRKRFYLVLGRERSARATADYVGRASSCPRPARASSISLSSALRSGSGVGGASSTSSVLKISDCGFACRISICRNSFVRACRSSWRRASLDLDMSTRIVHSGSYGHGRKRFYLVTDREPQWSNQDASLAALPTPMALAALG